MIVQFVLSLAVLSVAEQATGTDVLDIHMKPQEKLASQTKGRISLQNTGKLRPLPKCSLMELCRTSVNYQQKNNTDKKSS